MPEVIIPISVFATIFGIVYLFFTTRHKERMAMIEKGMDLSLLSKKSENSSPINFWVIKLGLLMVGIATGVFLGSLASRSLLLNEEEAYPTMILLFGGLALIGSYFLEKKLRKAS